MKIVQIITRMDVVGGAQNHVQDLAIGLKEKGHSLTIISGEEGNIHQAIEEEDIEYMHSQYLKRALNPLADCKAFLDIRRKLQRIQPDVIATHSAKAGVIGRLAGRSLSIPVIFTAHGWSFTEGIPSKRKFLYKQVERLMGSITNGVITVSDYDLKLAQRNKVARNSMLLTIHNGVHDMTKLKRKIKREGIIHLIMVARFEKPKRQLDVIKALQTIDPNQWHVIFAGDGPLQREAENYVVENRLQDSVTFLGRCHDVDELLKESDIFILLSDWEGLPLSILEAMRSGLPIIASDVGGIREAVTDQVNGLLIQQNHFNQVAVQIKTLLENADLRFKMGEASREIYENQYTFQHMLNKTHEFYNEVVPNKQQALTSKEELLDESIN